jgi:nucleoside-diphosphate-sugar epimerase
MTFLITGASGFVGQTLCAELIRRQVSIRAAVRRHSPAANAEQIVVANIDGKTDWAAALRGVSVIVHLAGRAHVMADRSVDPLAEYRQTNVVGTVNLAQQAADAGVKRMVFISSVKVNGEFTMTGKPFTERDVPKPQDFYGISKNEAEVAFRRVADENSMEWVVIRPPLVYGPGVKANFAALVNAVRRGLPLPLGSIENRRSLVALDNLVDFIALCAIDARATRSTFLISDGNDLSTPELIRKIAIAAQVEPRLFGFPTNVLSAVADLLGRRGAFERLCGNLQIDLSHAKNQLGWSPVISVDEALRRTLINMAKL